MASPEKLQSALKIEWERGHDETMDRLDRFAERKGLLRAAAARMLIKEGLDHAEAQDGRSHR